MHLVGCETACRFGECMLQLLKAAMPTEPRMLSYWGGSRSRLAESFILSLGLSLLQQQRQTCIHLPFARHSSFGMGRRLDAVLTRKALVPNVGSKRDGGNTVRAHRGGVPRRTPLQKPHPLLCLHP